MWRYWHCSPEGSCVRIGYRFKKKPTYQSCLVSSSGLPHILTSESDSSNAEDAGKSLNQTWFDWEFIFQINNESFDIYQSLLVSFSVTCTTVMDLSKVQLLNVVSTLNTMHWWPHVTINFKSNLLNIFFLL